jgi:hypothetical protein
MTFPYVFVNISIIIFLRFRPIGADLFDMDGRMNDSHHEPNIRFPDI